MAKGDATDLIMRFELKSGKQVPGESRTNLDLTKGGLVSGFQQGYMFEIDSFTLKAGLFDDDDEGDDEAKKKKKKEKEKDKDGKKKKGAKGGFRKWRNGEKGEYPVEMPPIEFKRVTDAASTTLLQNCIDKVIYPRATLIKRKAAGGPAAGEVYLRFDFVDVLVIKVDIDNDDPITESYEFICRGLLMSYLPQLPDGSLGAPISCWYRSHPDVVEPSI